MRDSLLSRQGQCSSWRFKRKGVLEPPNKVIENYYSFTLIHSDQGNQFEALKTDNIANEDLRGIDKNLEVKDNRARYLMNRIWMPKFGRFRKVIMDEAYKTKYSVHPGSDKRYMDLKKTYW